ncbi:MAG: hypothetical protein HY362_01870 [Candidatus Aenigmarchaeota archaeon]|nr:hypothetical protein [Candidatus Aenigmarchaeota archaeon]
MKIGATQFFIGAAIVSLVLIAGCTNQSTSTSATGQTSLIVTVAKGLIFDATVSAYTLNDDGTKGSLIAGPIGSSPNGNVYMSLPQNSPPIILIESVGGFYRDEATNSTVQLSDTDVMSTVMTSNLTQASVTPFTNMATKLAINKIKKGTKTVDAVNFANRIVSQQYRIDIVNTPPVAANDPDSVLLGSREQREYGVLLAGLSQQANDLDVNPLDLENALVNDWSDGTLDGKENDKDIEMKDSTGKKVDVSASTGLERLQDGVDKFIKSDNDATNLKDFSIATKPVSADPKFYIDAPSSYVWVANSFNSYHLFSKGGKPPYTWTVKEGSAIPNGFTLGESGVLSGTAPALDRGTTSKITPPFTVVVTDSTGEIHEIEIRIIIRGQAPVITTSTVTCVENEKCNANIASATGGTKPYYFRFGSFRSSTPPFGMGLSFDGSVIGESTTAGTYVFEVCVVDSVGESDCKLARLIITQKDQPTTTGQGPATTNRVAKIKTRTLTINFAGTGTGGVALVTAESGAENAEICPGPAPCVFTYNESQIVGLGSKADEGSVFSDWAGGCVTTGSACKVTMDSDIQVTATFGKLRKYTLTVVKDGAGTGYVTNPPKFEISCGDDCSAELSFDDNDKSIGANLVSLVAKPDYGSTFDRWSGPCDFVNYKPTDIACLIRNMTKDETVHAKFDATTTTTTTTLPPVVEKISLTSKTCTPKTFKTSTGQYTNYELTATGTASGPVGDTITEYWITSIKCDSWGTLESKSNTDTTTYCKRRPGDPETTQWSMFQDADHSWSGRTVSVKRPGTSYSASTPEIKCK